MPSRHDTSDAASELAGFIVRHPDTAWLDALVVDLAGTLRHYTARRARTRAMPVGRVPRGARIAASGAHA